MERLRGTPPCLRPAFRRIRENPRWLECACALLAFTCTASADLQINEIYYNVVPQGGNQFVEIYNPGPGTEHLDGMVLTDEASVGLEGVYRWPGLPGETNFPVPAGSYVVVAVDATNATSTAAWECYAGGSDTDNPLVPNLLLVAGTQDLSLFLNEDNVILADGTDITQPIDPLTVVDAVNYGSSHGELCSIGPGIPDLEPNIGAAVGLSLGRCPNGQDSNVSSASDFYPFPISRGTANGNCVGLPVLSVADAGKLEGNSGSSLLSFTVSLSPAAVSNVFVRVTTADITATNGSDYTALPSGTMLTFGPGSHSQTVSVSITGDTITESTETFFVILSAATNAVITDAAAIGTILDDEGSPSLFVTDAQVTEGNSGTTSATFVVTLSASSLSTVSVSCSTSNSTAEAPSDYTAFSGTLLTFAPGVQTQTVSVAVNGDTAPEQSEIFALTLSSPTNALIADSTGQGLILNDDTLNISAIARTGSSVTVTWNAGAQADYQLQASTNLNLPSWSDVGVVVTATGATASASDTNASVLILRNYRVLPVP